MDCPNCSAAMEAIELAGVSVTTQELDLCFPCHLIWLDRKESIHLSPRGTLELFRALHQHREDAREPLAGRLACPRCDRRLSLAQDMVKDMRFFFYNCPAADGRLVPFSEFLKEKQFVRPLGRAETERLKAAVRQVQCSSCGAPIDLAGAHACEHCGAPISILDPDAVAHTVRRLKAGGVDPEQPARDYERALAEFHEARAEGREGSGTQYTDRYGLVADIDVLGRSFGALGGLLDSLL